MIGITYGIEPYGGHVMGWTNPLVLEGPWPSASCSWWRSCRVGPAYPSPCSASSLFKIRAFTSGGSLASFTGRPQPGGDWMFMLIIWLQGIWLPLHGYAFSVTPLWAGIAMLPLTLGFLVAGPLSGILFGPVRFPTVATGGMLGTAVCLFLLELLPVDFPYWMFAPLLFRHGDVHGLVRARPTGPVARWLQGSSCRHRLSLAPALGPARLPA